MSRPGVGGLPLIVAVAAAMLAVFAAQSLSVLAVLAALACIAAGRHRGMLHDRLVVAAALLVLLMAASALWSLAPARSLQTAGAAGSVIVAGALAAAALRVEGLGRWRMALLAGFLLLVLLLLFEMASAGTLRGWLTQAVGAVPRRWGAETLSRPVVLVCLLAWAVALALRGWMRVLPLLLAAIVVSVAELHTARFGLAAGIAGAAVVWVIGPVAVRAAGYAVAAAVIAMPMLVAFVLEPSRWQWLAEFRNSALHRLYIWSFVNDFVFERPLYGWGAEASRSLPGGDRPAPSGGFLIQLHPHNGAMQVWVELGLAGALLAAAIVVIVTSRIAALPERRHQAVGLGLFATATSFWLFSFGIWQAWWLGALVIGACAFAVALKADR
jgi:O-antigen ligase